MAVLRVTSVQLNHFERLVQLNRMRWDSSRTAREVQCPGCLRCGTRIRSAGRPRRTLAEVYFVGVRFGAGERGPVAYGFACKPGYWQTGHSNELVVMC